ncbi:MAG TPA: pyruvate ferredoxin oxidoreductase [bacterium]|nr:pyruvate ferredoxin oxidoreductase [bacterium]HPT29744.1 pyruvate ferredoxin oxidoreductase [bacterium]
MKDKNRQILEGSRAIALTIKNIAPDVISAYPITPQTHIVEDLAKFKADGLANYEYLRAESEFAAASIVLGASAAGSRVYSATSSQGLLLMTEVIFSITGLRLPIVMTCANRTISSPINIWNDHQDIMALTASGWIMLFAETNQEAVFQHILAYKIAETTKLPVMVNVDGFILTHSYEPLSIPEAGKIKKYLGQYHPAAGTYLDTKNPVTLGSFVSPKDYFEIRQELNDDLIASLKTINQEYFKCHKALGTSGTKNENGLFEYYGPRNAKTIIIALGSVIGTIKDVADQQKNVGVIKIKCFNPFPYQDLAKILKSAKQIAILEKATNLGSAAPLFSRILPILNRDQVAKSYIAGLGGRDITQKMIQGIINDIMKTKKTSLDSKFVNK